MTEDQKTYLKAAITTAISMAGVGAFVRNWKAKKDRKKSYDLEKDKNVIVVPISKDDFMKDIPTPDERKRDMESKIVGELESNGGLGGFFDFFKKKASGENNDSPVEESKKDAGTPVNEKKVTEEKIDGRTVLRGQDGKFVSQTDPVAAIDVEKSAEMGILDSVLHPIEFLKSVGKESVNGPLMLAGGALGSAYLASKLVDIIGKNRKKNAKERQENARDAYITLLENGEGSEKKADVDLPKATGMVLGTSFFVPMALAAVVANKIIENRDAERKKKKEMFNSYPGDPTFLYNVVGGEKIAMSTDRALALMMFKTAMVASCEEDGLEKTAIFEGVKKYIDKNQIGTEEARDHILKLLEDNPDDMLDIIRKRTNGDNEAASGAIFNLIGSKGGGLNKRLLLSGYGGQKKLNELYNSIYSSPKLTELVANRFTDDKFKDTYGAYADELIGKKLGLRQGSFLHEIVLWLTNLFGMRKDLINGEVNNTIKSMADEARAKYDKLNISDNKNNEQVQAGSVNEPEPSPSPSGGQQIAAGTVPLPSGPQVAAQNDQNSHAPAKSVIQPAQNKPPVPPAQPQTGSLVGQKNVPSSGNGSPSIIPTAKNPGAAIMNPVKAIKIMSDPVGFWKSFGIGD